jgi:hypothetical protein
MEGLSKLKDFRDLPEAIATEIQVAAGRRGQVLPGR